MKRFVILLSCVSLWGFPGCGLGPKLPKHDIRVHGQLIEVAEDNYFLFRGTGGTIREGHVSEKDTLTIGDSLHRFVFFAKIIPDRLSRDFNNIPSFPTALHILYVRGSFARQAVPGYGSREFVVVDGVVGVQ